MDNNVTNDSMIAPVPPCCDCKVCLMPVVTASVNSASEDDQKLLGLFKLGCSCSFHYQCLVDFFRSKLADRSSVLATGIECPNGVSCAFYDKGNYYCIDEDDLGPMVKFGNSIKSNAKKCKKSELSSYSTEACGLSSDTTHTELLEFIDSSVFSLKESTKLMQWVNERASNNMNKLYKLDSYVAATTKGCPECSYRTSHFQGHACHSIKCPNCTSKYCYKCLCSEDMNDKKRGSRYTCLCGSMHSFCNSMTDLNDISRYIKFEGNIPYDSRCGCSFCPDCKPNLPCFHCSGDCSVCLGFILPGPAEILPVNSKLMTIKGILGISLKDKDNKELTTKLINKAYLLWDICRHGLYFEPASNLDTIINRSDNHGRTGLSYACGANRVGVIPLLLQNANIDVNIPDIYGKTALHYAAQYGYIEPIQMLLQRTEIGINLRSNYSGSSNASNSIGSGQTPLVCAIQNRHLDCISLFIADPRIDLDAGNPLHAACSSRNIQAIVLLIGSPILDINAKDASGNTSLHLVCASGDFEVAKLLLGSSTIDINRVDATGSSALLKAMVALSPCCVNALLTKQDSGLDVNFDYGVERTVLHWASIHGFIDTVSILLARPDIDGHKLDSDGYSALYWASSNGHLDVVYQLAAHHRRNEGINNNNNNNSNSSSINKSEDREDGSCGGTGDSAGAGGDSFDTAALSDSNINPNQHSKGRFELLFDDESGENSPIDCSSTPSKP